MKATLEVFPDAQIKGCFFHFCQCLWRKLQGLGLAVAYKAMPEIRTWFRMALALPMLPVAQVVDGFNLVKERSPDVPKSCRDNNVAGSKFRHVMDNTGPRIQVLYM